MSCAETFACTSNLRVCLQCAAVLLGLSDNSGFIDKGIVQFRKWWKTERNTGLCHYM